MTQQCSTPREHTALSHRERAPTDQTLAFPLLIRCTDRHLQKQNAAFDILFGSRLILGLFIKERHIWPQNWNLVKVFIFYKAGNSKFPPWHPQMVDIFCNKCFKTKFCTSFLYGKSTKILEPNSHPCWVFILSSPLIYIKLLQNDILYALDVCVCTRAKREPFYAAYNGCLPGRIRFQ